VNITSDQYLSDNIDANPKPLDYISDTSIFGGIIFNQYGHFMSESIHRLWARDDKHSFVFLVYPNKNGCYPSSFDDLLDYQKDAFEYLGVAKRIRLIGVPTKINRLIIPSQASFLGKDYTLDRCYVDFLKDIESRRLDRQLADSGESNTNHTKRKIYVSRSHLPGKSSLIGETYLEKELEMEGFYIMRPDYFKLDEKLDLFRNADLLIFPEGSAIHGIQVLGELKAKVVILARTKKKVALDINIHVFTSRSADVIVFDNIETISSLSWSYENNRPIHAHELSRTNPEKLVSFLRDNSLASLSKFSIQDFHSAEREDLLRYILETDIRNTRPPEFMDLFLQFRKDLKKKI